MTGVPGDDEQLGRELDAYLRVLEGRRASVSPASTAELADLRAVIADLHCLARVAGLESDEPSSAASVPYLPGNHLGKYRIKRHLGQGGQSITLLAVDTQLQRDVVVKLYRRGTSPEQREKVLREGRALARLASPFLARCYDASEHDGQSFLVLEYIPGQTLEQFARGKEFSAEEIAGLIADLASGLTEIHGGGLVHRDLKPRNVVVGDDGRPRIVDFGLALAGVESTSAVSGTPAYMAPEQARGETGRIDARTDIFGLGAVFYELLTGQPPFRAPTREQALAKARQGNFEPVQSLAPGKPRSICRICARCLAKDPGQRVPSAVELRKALLGWQRRRRLARGASAALVAAGLLLLTFGLLAGFEFRPRAAARVFTAGVTVTSETPIPRAALPEEVLSFFAVDGEFRKDFFLSVQVLGAVADSENMMQLDDGDRITLRVVSDQDCYVTVFSCGDGPPVQLFPDPQFDDERDALVRAGQATTIPRLDGRKTLRAAIRAVPSTGREALCLMAATHPAALGLDAAGEPLLEFQTAADPEALRARLRGLVRRVETPGRAVSQIVIPYRVAPSLDRAPREDS